MKIVLATTSIMEKLSETDATRNFSYILANYPFKTRNNYVKFGLVTKYKRDTVIKLTVF
jgi:hypothetical protein